MKKILIIMMCLILVTGCDNAKKVSTNASTNTTGNTEESKTNTETGTTDYESDYYQIIGLSEFKELYNSATPKLIYFGSDTCSACLSFKPYAKQFAKEEKTKVYFVLLDKLTSEEQTELYDLVKFEYIPFITVYKNKEQLYGDSGVISVDDLKSLASTYGVKSE